MTARWVEVAALALLAWVVAVPLTRRYAAARRTADAPTAALVLWQAIGLSGGLAVLTAELTVAAGAHPGHWRDAVGDALDEPFGDGPVRVLGLTLFALSALWLVGVLVGSFERARRSRREHRALLELLAEPAFAHETRFDVLDTPEPVAYALPGRLLHGRLLSGPPAPGSPPRGSRVVVTSAARARLTSEQLHAVLLHECAHLRQRHSLLVGPFVAWQRSLPFLHTPALARRRVEDLAEMVCDDAALRVVTPAALSSALAVLATSRCDVAERTARLTSHAPHRPVAAVLLACALVLVALPPAVLLLLPH